VTGIDSLKVGNAAVWLGAGRERASDGVDARAGVVLCKKCGDNVQKGDVIAHVHGDRGKDNVRRGGDMVRETFGAGKKGEYKKQKLITHVVTKDGVEEFDDRVLL
jgi:pyrimidine-nucleoside phosphorylase